jgi:hypothetical protein
MRAQGPKLTPGLGSGVAQRCCQPSGYLSLPGPLNACRLLYQRCRSSPRAWRKANNAAWPGVEAIVIMTASSTSSGRIGGSEINLRSWGGPAAVTLVAAAALISDALTPQVVSVTAFYVGLVLIGYWLPQPKAALALALLATPLIIIGHWISIPESTPEWEGWANRSLSIGSVWLTAVFVWRMRVLEQELRQQTEVANRHSRERAWISSIVEFGDDAIVRPLWWR